MAKFKLMSSSLYGIHHKQDVLTVHIFRDHNNAIRIDTTLNVRVVLAHYAMLDASRLASTSDASHKQYLIGFAEWLAGIMDAKDDFYSMASIRSEFLKDGYSMLTDATECYRSIMEPMAKKYELEFQDWSDAI